MLDIIPDLIENIKDENTEEVVDILEISSEVIFNIIKEHRSEDIPSYIRKLDLEDYFGDRITGAQAIKKIQNAWEVNRKGFEINRKRSQLIYDARETWEADRILKELPEDLDATKSSNFVIMDLNRATSFFEIWGRSFSFGGLAGITYEYKDIPIEWKQVIVKREYIEDLSNKFYVSLTKNKNLGANNKNKLIQCINIK